jgi:hypothetical protein
LSVTLACWPSSTGLRTVAVHPPAAQFRVGEGFGSGFDVGIAAGDGVGSAVAAAMGDGVGAWLGSADELDAGVPVTLGEALAVDVDCSVGWLLGWVVGAAQLPSSATRTIPRTTNRRDAVTITPSSPAPE